MRAGRSKWRRPENLPSSPPPPPPSTQGVVDGPVIEIEFGDALPKAQGPRPLCCTAAFFCFVARTVWDQGNR